MYSEIRSISLGVNIISMFIILILCINQMYEKDVYKAMKETWHLLTLCLMFLIVCVAIFKIRLFFEELFYINSHYNGNFVSVVKATLNFNVPSWVVFAITIVAFMMLVMHSNFNMIQIMQLNPFATLLAIAFSILLFYTINITECRATTVATIFSTGLNPGTAMASSYFYGYLKIILPASGGIERAGILNALETFESKNKVTVPVKKLFILIPSSSYIPPDLKEISNNWLEYVQPLETIAIDRAGVKNRTYHNTIYKFRSNGPNKAGKSYYLATEGATPLKTFLEVQDNSHRYAALYREFNREIIKSFYTTLQNLLNDNPDCKHYCELVYYEDTKGGERTNPAHILRDRIDKYMGDQIIKIKDFK
ncbi:hypothetical protein TSAR_001108 [Trichomalopsis sarcophagae]|uniref:STING ligand-binding domain-containing protein n=1 Tax=Trichomalopsis sarcophagae TaxID=543379 RepID=A0A232FGW4_9HYME|nr:hypothetical protein TSAR_001108 [Trichomalopsis sarcophagae]